MDTERKREFRFTKKDFRFLSELVFDNTGIVLHEKKFEMVYSRLARRLRHLGFSKFKEYVELLKSDKAENELANLMDAITTNLTRFFRESHQFKDFVSRVLDKKKETAKQGGDKKIRIWSAGCSGGQEPYSLAMIMASYLKSDKNWDILILATDIDRNMLKKGQLGIYSKEEMQSLPESFAKKYIRKINENEYEIVPEIKQMVRFKSLNLLTKWPIKNSFDVIFCRNVVIYFDNETKENLVSRFSEKLFPNGILYLGHSEANIEERKYLKPIGRASFQKVAA